MRLKDLVTDDELMAAEAELIETANDLDNKAIRKDFPKFSEIQSGDPGVFVRTTLRIIDMALQRKGANNA